MKKPVPIKKQIAKIKIGFDFSNTITKIFINNKTYKFKTTVLVEGQNLTIGGKHPKQYQLYLFNLVDLITSLKDVKNSKSLEDFIKYYTFELDQNNQYQILLNLKVLQQFQFKRKEKINLHQALYCFIYNTFLYCIQKQFPNYEGFQYDVCANFYGFQTNIYKFVLENTFKLMPLKVRLFFRKSTAALASYYYLKQCQQLKMSKKLAVLQFGDRGLAFSIYKMNPHSQRIIQCLQNFQYAFGGISITRIIIDLIVQNVKIQNGIDIMNHPEISSKLPKIAQEAKIALSSQDTVFIRVSGYPLESPCGFYLVKGKVEKKMFDPLKFMFEKIKKLIKTYEKQKLQFLLSGNSCNVPLFKSQLNKLYHKQIILASENWLSQGLFFTLSSQLTILQVLSETIKLIGDQGYEEIVATKNCDLPTRFMRELSFPSSQLTFTIKILQYSTCIGTYVVDASKLKFDQKFDYIIQIQQNKTIKMYSSRKFGTISMKGDCKILLQNQHIYKAKVIQLQ